MDELPSKDMLINTGHIYMTQRNIFSQSLKRFAFKMSNTSCKCQIYIGVFRQIF